MKTLFEFLNQLRNLQVKFWMEGDRLRFSAPNGVLTASVRQELAHRKSEIIALLRGCATQQFAPLVRVVPRPRLVPLSLMQQQLFFLDQLIRGNPAYNVTFAFRLSGTLDVVAVRQGISAILQRHESLRTTFPMSNGQPVQMITPEQPLELPIVSLESLDGANRDAEAARLACEDGDVPFDLTRFPLFRCKLARLSEEEHVLILVVHHIVFDGWSGRLFMEEFAARYAAIRTGRELQMTPLRIQYADYALWQRNQVDSGAFQNQREYWRRQLIGLPVLTLHADRARSAVQTFCGATHAFGLSADLVDVLEDLGRREGITLFVTLLTGFQALLARYTGQTDICVGSPFANRTYSETENMIGLFLNMLVLRTELSGNPQFLELLRRVREVTVGALTNGEFPFACVVEELQPKRTLSHTPLFQVVFELQSGLPAIITAADLTIVPLELGSRTAKFDLMLSMEKNSDGLGGVVEYNTDLLDVSTISRLMDHYRILLEEMGRDPGQRLGDIELLTAEERVELLERRNATAVEYPKDKCAHELFEERVRRSPEAVAVVAGERELSYRQLNERSNALAHYLRQLGVGPEVRVGICMERCVEMIVALLGIWKAGGAFVPLDPIYPRERLEYMIGDAGVRILLTQQRQRQRLTGCAERLVCLDADWGQIAAYGMDNLASLATSRNLSYVMYTSGSTGKPKGVEVTHGNIVRLVRANNYAHLGADEVILQMAPLVFDASTFEIWGSLCNGAQLVLYPRGQPSIVGLTEVVQRYGVTTLWLTASLFHQVANGEMRRLGGLRQLLAGGDVLKVADVEKVRAELPDCRVINGYGPTESTTFACCYTVSAEGLAGTAVPIGLPIANTQMYVLDREMRPVPVGVPGELYIGGDGLARGYLNRPELTAERFVPDPFSGRAGARLYRTGDLARYLSDRGGNIEFLGRLDHQVKVRGFRVELGEVETTLAAHSGVREVVVMAREDVPGDKRLVAYLVPVVGHRLSSQELRSYLQEQLPEYMVPSAFVILEQLPLMSNGKLDRLALPAPEQRRPEMEKAYVAPRTETEARLARIWADVLRLDQVGVQDNFFELGGDSILSIQIIARAHQAGLRLSPRLLFQNQTIETLAAIAGQSAPQPNQSNDVDIIPLNPLIQLPSGELDRLAEFGPIEDIYPLSALQQGLLFHTLYAPGSGTYFEQVSCRLEGPLEAMEFLGTWQRAVKRHAVLRSAFFWDRRGEPFQVAYRHADVPVQQEDWQGLDEEEQRKKLEGYVRSDRRRGFDLDKAPLLRLLLVRLDEQAHQFVLSFHHLLLDGWSFAALLQEVFAEYQGRRDGCGVEILLRRPYRDYIAWLQQQDREKAEAYWRGALAGFQASTALGVDRIAARVEEGLEYGVEQVELAGATLAMLQRLVRGRQLTLNTVIQGAWALLLSRYSGQSDVVFGAVVSGRPAELAGAEAMIGLFINTLPVRVQVRAAETVSGWLSQLQREQVEARQYDYSPLVEIQGWSEVPRGQPLFESLLIFENYPVDGSLKKDFGILRSNEVQIFEQTNYPVTIKAIPGLNLSLKILYDQRRFEREAIGRMLGHLGQLLEGMGKDPGQRLEDIELVTAEERVELLERRNATAVEYPKDKCAHELFEERVRRSPEAVAVVAGERELSYGQLNERSNALAHYLRELGVGPEVRVGICMERCVEMIVALLGIWKAGGAFVPLDPVYPRERLEYMIGDAGVRILLTQQRQRQRLTGYAERLVCLDADWGQIAAYGIDNPASLATSRNLSYVMYTSGSTGKPKGVLIPHQGLVNYLVWCLDAYGAERGEGAPVHSTVAADAGFPNLFGPLLVSKRILMLPEEQPLQALADTVATGHHFSLLKITPSQLEVLHSLLSAEAPEGWVRTLVIGAEALRGDLLEYWQRGAPKTVLLNEYGPTETVVGCSIYEVPRRKSISGAVPIGLPIANTQMYVLDREMRPVPVGVPGELYIGGDGLARGYLNRPELTAERFVPDPFSGRAGARLYRTGDLARYLSDRGGNIEFLGRLDHQVKVRGFRVELGEVETTLAAHSGVREVVVMAREDVPGDKRLVAYLVPVVGHRLSSQELRSYLQEQLPEYMVPSAFVILEQLPLMSNGKLDRLALPAPEQRRPEMEKAYVAPRTETEARLARIWADVLRLDQVGVQDNFFELGGDSILSIQIIARAHQAGLRLSPRLLFQNQTIETLAAIAGQSAPRAPHESNVTGAVPLTPIQRWFFEQNLTDPHHWNQALVLESTEALQPELVEQALQHLLEQHEALRLRFHKEDGEWIQEVTETAEFRLKRVKLGELPEWEQAGVREAEAAALHRGLDLERGPLMAAVLFEHRSRSCDVLLLVAHHLVIDTVSWRILVEDLQQVYKQLRRGEPVEVGRKSDSWRSWACRLAQYGASGELEEQEGSYWEAVTNGHRLQMPLADAQGHNSEASARTLTMELSAFQTEALLREAPAAYRTQINDLLLTALVESWRRWSGAWRLRIDLEGHGREDLFDEIDLSRTVGWFTSLFPVELNLEGVEQGDWGKALRTVKEQLRVIPQRGIGYGILRYLGASRELRERLGGQPRPEISFNYLGQFDQQFSQSRLFRLASYEGGPARSKRARRSHVLEINALIVGGRLLVQWIYSENLHKREQIESLAQGFIAALHALIAHCQSPNAGGYTPSDFPEAHLSQADLDRLLSRLTDNT